MTLASPLEITCVSKLRKGSSAALWSQCFSRSSFFCSGVFKNIRIILLFFILLFISCLYIDKAFNVLLLQQFSFHFCFNIVVHTISSYKKRIKHARHELQNRKVVVCTGKNVFISVCECCLFPFAEVHFGSINLHERKRFNKHFSHR